MSRGMLDYEADKRFMHYKELQKQMQDLGRWSDWGKLPGEGPVWMEEATSDWRCLSPYRMLSVKTPA